MSASRPIPATMYRTPHVRRIIAIEASSRGLTSAEVVSSSHSPLVVAARVGVMRRLRGEGRSLNAIGKIFGVHHSTVHHHLTKARRDPLYLASREIPVPDLSGEWAI